MKTRNIALTFFGVVLATIFTTEVSAQTPFVETYTFSQANSTSGTTDPTTPPTTPSAVVDLAFGSFTSTGASANPNATGRFSFTSQPLGGVPNSDDFSQFTGSLSPTVYFEVTLTPLGVIEYQIDSITFSVRRSGTGVRSYAVRSSVDGFASNLPAIINNGNANLGIGPANELQWLFDATSNAADQDGSQINPGVSHASLTTPVTFRFYGWNAEAGTGTFSVDNVAFSGSTRPGVPEPTTGCLLALGIAALAFAGRRRV